MISDVCPDSNRLAAFHDGRMAVGEIDHVAAHLEHCPGCEQRLQALDQRTGQLADGLAGAPVPVAVPTVPATAVVGTMVGGRYKLVELVGEGGMGEVWMALQTEPIRRPVAVKLIKPGMDSRLVLARFEAERQALALMDHPNIARVLDAGATEHGRPYFVLELVKGVPITRFCDEHRLTPRQRLELFVPVCQAVQHAHQKGVIHRDLKPSNVLVARYDDKPVPKVIDFGVAKAAGQALTDRTLMTGFGSVIGTPEYMSPEQATFNALDVDTRTDVYALGVILYELLTGTTPLGRKQLTTAGLLEALRVVREHDPPRPSARLSTSETLPALAAERSTEPRKLPGLVRGEVDWIVMKALEKDRSRRYATANGLAGDIERYLTGEPVQAVPASATYRLRKLARRHRGPVVAIAVVALALMGGIVGTAIGLIHAERARARAVAEADRAVQAEHRAADKLEEANRERDRADQSRRASELVGGFLYYDIIRQADVRSQAEWREVADPDLTLREVLDRAAAKIDRMAADPAQNENFNPRAESLIRWAIGDAFVSVGKPEKALPHLERAREILAADPAFGPSHSETLFGVHKLSLAYRALGRPGKALELSHDAVLRFRARNVTGDSGIVSAMNDIALAHRDLGEREAAVRQMEEALAEARHFPDPNGEQLVLNLNLADAYRAAGRLADARRIVDKLLADPASATDDPLAAYCHEIAGLVCLDASEWKAAEQRFQEALTVTQRREPHAWSTALTSARLGRALAQQGKDAEGEPLLLMAHERLTALRATTPVPSRSRFAEVAGWLAELYAARGDAGAAKRWRDQEARDAPGKPLH